MTMIINARSHSEDPAQEHLRERKDKWNASCRQYIALLNASKPHLIAFKRGLNGRGDAKVGLPTSDISEAFPAEIGGYLGSVGSEFNELASMFAALVTEANGIIQEQAYYAQTRRRSQRHVADIHHNEDLLIAEGSNYVTRTWAKIRALRHHDLGKNERLSMLEASAKFFKTLVNYEDLILAQGIDNVDVLVQKFMLISNKTDTLIRDYENLKEVRDPKPKSDKENTPPNEGAEQADGKDNKSPSGKGNRRPSRAKPTPPQNQGERGNSPISDNPVEAPHPINNSTPSDLPFLDLKENIVAMRKAGLFSMEGINNFLNIFYATKREKEKDPKDQDKIDVMEDRVREIYLEYLDKAKYIIEQNHNVKLPKNVTLEELINLKRNASNHSLNMVKHSGYLSRWWNSTLHGKSPDPSSAARLAIYNIIKDMKIQIDQTMDLLEGQDVNVKDLGEKITELTKLRDSINEPLGRLVMLHKDKYYEQDISNRKHQILDPALRYFNRQIRHDIDKPGW
jgi:hypothetical protein